MDFILSKWHLITIAAGVISFIAMRLGKYTARETAKATLVTFFAFYIGLSFVAYFTKEKAADVSSESVNTIEDQMIAGLDQEYEQNKGITSNSHLAAYVNSFEQDGEYTIDIYVGNYDNTESFQGDVSILVLDTEGNTQEKTFEDLSLKPGEKKGIEHFTSTVGAVQYKYKFEEK
ncbi:hypothetical protein DCC39_12220 [Pueribacillus theae]|uniref:Uncharacterized protein n=1 Tax=Pueribacillus theae TaxID=2171751 RepID=A0A2U1JWZ9_9BACI|nr:hypothetical protein [Pueribacillus theae]PWA09727.1 hypothetical protein DCC39_12220 [Pueribacillus theae]